MQCVCGAEGCLREIIRQLIGTGSGCVSVGVSAVRRIDPSGLYVLTTRTLYKSY